jgi:N-dimethylarginine dimethylaminohydrolase
VADNIDDALQVVHLDTHKNYLMDQVKAILKNNPDQAIVKKQIEGLFKEKGIVALIVDEPEAQRSETSVVACALQMVL